MLGRLRAAYEYFISVALTFDEVRNIEFKAVRESSTPLNAIQFRKTVRKITEELRLPKVLINGAKAETGASRLHVHAEMQILLHLVTDADSLRRSHRYIGSSKKLCFLCSRVLHHYIPLTREGPRRAAFTARPSHRKIYPLWTLPAKVIPAGTARLAIASALVDVLHEMRHYLQGGLAVEPAIAEPSAGVTDSRSLPAGLSAAKKDHIKKQRIGTSSTKTERSERPCLTTKVKLARVAVLPADGSKPRTTQVYFYEIPKDATSQQSLWEVGKDLVPSFDASWGEFQSDRRFRMLPIPEPASKEIIGSYRIYWNENEDDQLHENRYIKKLIGVDQVEPCRRFWYGDAFIVRASANPDHDVADEIEDVPDSILGLEALRVQFKDMWDTQYLERELDKDRSDQACDEKERYDMDITFNRMGVRHDLIYANVPYDRRQNCRTPAEKKLLRHSPPGTLEYMAIHGCDDGAVKFSSIEQHPEDPTMGRIKILQKRTALDLNGWTGFSSSQL